MNPKTNLSASAAAEISAALNNHKFFTVKGERFFSIGAQLHNSSGYALGAASGDQYASDTEWALRAAKELGVNTIAVPVCWDQFEQEEGSYNTGYVERIIEKARLGGLHLVLLWFATWKNGQMEYTPSWVKRDRKRFKRCVMKDGSESTALSPFCEETRKADLCAFLKMVKTVRRFDESENTVIAIQVENESGALAASIRDFSEEGNRAFAAQVPAELIKAAAVDEHLIGEAYRKNGQKPSGSWKEVFGNLGAEACMAWGTARYIDSIAAAGKQIYDIFMYVNVWTDGNSDIGWSMAGMNYPSGGAVSKMLPVWNCAIHALDAICPDVYITYPAAVEKTQDFYSGYDFPFYIPESGASAVNASLMMRGIGECNAIGWHIFALESYLEADGSLSPGAQIIRRSYQILESARPLLEEKVSYQEKYAIYQHPGEDSHRMDLGRWLVRCSFAGAESTFTGWVASDWRNSRDLYRCYEVPQNISDETARGLLFRVSENEFYLVGHKVRLYIQKNDFSEGWFPINMMDHEHQAHNMELIKIEEGHFEGTEFVVDRLRSGDEGRHGIWAQAGCGVVHFVLGWEN